MNLIQLLLFLLFGGQTMAFSSADATACKGEPAAEQCAPPPVAAPRKSAPRSGLYVGF